MVKKVKQRSNGIAIVTKEIRPGRNTSICPGIERFPLISGNSFFDLPSVESKDEIATLFRVKVLEGQEKFREYSRIIGKHYRNNIIEIIGWTDTYIVGPKPRKVLE